jgi:hypothetical protein
MTLQPTPAATTTATAKPWRMPAAMTAVSLLLVLVAGWAIGLGAGEADDERRDRWGAALTAVGQVSPDTPVPAAIPAASQAWPTVYLVSTPEQADALRADLALDADQGGAPRPTARVVVAGTEEAAIVLREINDPVLAGHIPLFDRRTPEIPTRTE